MAGVDYRSHEVRLRDLNDTVEAYAAHVVEARVSGDTESVEYWRDRLEEAREELRREQLLG